eukprot:1444267-Prymnesium_polylepis.1
MTTNALHRQTRRRHFSTWCEKPLSCFDPGSTALPSTVRCVRRGCAHVRADGDAGEASQPSSSPAGRPRRARPRHSDQ